MELNFQQMNDLIEVFTDLQTKSLPFKLSLIIAKDMNLLNKEVEFYIEQEKAFAEKYLAKDENGNYIKSVKTYLKLKKI